MSLWKMTYKMWPLTVVRLAGFSFPQICARMGPSEEPVPKKTKQPLFSRNLFRNQFSYSQTLDQDFYWTSNSRGLHLLIEKHNTTLWSYRLVVLRSEVQCAKLHTVAASNSRDHSIIACSRHLQYKYVLLLANFLFVVHRAYDTAPNEQPKWSSFSSYKNVAFIHSKYTTLISQYLLRLHFLQRNIESGLSNNRRAKSEVLVYLHEFERSRTNTLCDSQHQKTRNEEWCGCQATI